MKFFYGESNETRCQRPLRNIKLTLQSWTKYIETTAKIQVELTTPQPQINEGVMQPFSPLRSMLNDGRTTSCYLVNIE